MYSYYKTFDSAYTIKHLKELENILANAHMYKSPFKRSI